MEVVVWLLINIPPSNILQNCFCSKKKSKRVRPYLAIMIVNGVKSKQSIKKINVIDLNLYTYHLLIVFTITTVFFPCIAFCCMFIILTS